MSITTTLVDFRIDNGIDIIQFPDTVGLRYYNDSRDELIDSIIAEKEDFFYSYYSTTSVIGQNEYRLATRGESDGIGGTLNGIHKLKSISWKIKSTDTTLTKIPVVNLDNLDYDIESFDETVNPFYYVADNSFFLYPAPTEATEIKVYAIMYPKKLALSDNETLPDQYSKSIFYGMKKRYLESIGDIQGSGIASQKFEEEKNKVCLALSGRVTSPVQRTTPYLNNLS